MLAHRACSRELATRAQAASRGWGPACSARATPGTSSAIVSPLRRYDQLLVGASLEPRLGVQVGPDVLLGDEQQPGVGVGRLLQAARQLVQEELDDRVEALHVRLLVDREVEVAA